MNYCNMRYMYKNGLIDIQVTFLEDLYTYFNK